MDKYLSLDGPSEGSYKEKGSKFLAYAYPVSSEKEVKARINALKKEHYNARHHCYAYILGSDGSKYRAYDDGEPRHSAGDPILNQIKSSGCMDVLVVVVRYFGGTKLGKSGLINAYKTATKEALSNAQVIDKVPMVRFQINFDYEGMQDVMHTLQHYENHITNQQFEETCSLICQVPEAVADMLMHELKIFNSVKQVIRLPR